MIVVRVELWSAITGKVTEIARAEICNVGGSAEIGDYETRSLRGRSATAFAQRTIQRRGKVTGHRRKALHVWNLVAKALLAMGYGANAAGPLDNEESIDA